LLALRREGRRGTRERGRACPPLGPYAHGRGGASCVADRSRTRCFVDGTGARGCRAAKDANCFARSVGGSPVRLRTLCLRPRATGGAQSRSRPGRYVGAHGAQLERPASS
jgi:hypothetical protein